MFAIKLTPAYRHGAETPWGGDRLATFGLSIPDDRTGEALIASTLPGLESVAEDGTPLSALLGRRLSVLIKLIDAREALSVQVHPGDAYAAAREGGKLGKTEAWLVLQAAPGAKLVYGLTEGTDVRALDGAQIERHLRWVDVRPGDALFIPAGTVHAIGQGIVLYEIQQASDVTYRFWDWDRRDKDGKPRPLHWEKACDVADAGVRLDVTRGETARRAGGDVTRIFQNPFFALEKWSVRGNMAMPAQREHAFLTALCAGRLTRGAETIAFSAGETVFVPGNTDGVSVEANGELIIGYEGK